jgi:hypothetical protein
MEWQPIETAPKDREILLYGGDIHEGFWDELDFNEFSGTPIMGWNFGTADIDPTNFEPTHWMPLPRPPSDA